MNQVVSLFFINIINHTFCGFEIAVEVGKKIVGHFFFQMRPTVIIVRLPSIKIPVFFVICTLLFKLF